MRVRTASGRQLYSVALLALCLVHVAAGEVCWCLVFIFWCNMELDSAGDTVS